MLITEKLTNIANAIRIKTGKTNAMNLDDIVTEIMNMGTGGGLPSGIEKIAFGKITVSTQFTTGRQTFQHNLGTVPDAIIVYANSNVSQTYSMLCAIRWWNWRSGYTSHMAYHGNSTSTVTWQNSNSSTYGISNMTNDTFQLASNSSSYYWRAREYNYIAIKFS